MSIYHLRTHCRACGSENLAEILDLGTTALVNDFLPAERVAGYDRSAPLTLQLCRDCAFVQLREVVDPVVIYSDYAYVTSTSRTMDVHLEALTDQLLENGAFDTPPRVLEIASNTGQLLAKFAARGCEVLGIEPAANISELANRDGIPTRVEFFGTATAPGLRDEWGAADLVIGRHVFAHIDDLAGLIEALDVVAGERALVAFEVPYVVDFYRRTEFDTIYHEHLSYVSLHGIQALLADSPFMLYRADRYPIHGGSVVFQMVRRNRGLAAHPSVAACLAEERELGLHTVEAWQAFAARVKQICDGLHQLIADLKAQGARVIGYGASAKGNTLLQASRIGNQQLDYVIDNTPFKQNRLTPGTWIPVAPPERLLEDQPDYALLLAWNFADEIITREQEYQRRGGRFIVPIPTPRIVDYPNNPD